MSQHVAAGLQRRNHVFKVWRSSSLAYYPSTKKIDRSTQFGAVGYTITLFIKTLRENLGVRRNCGGQDPPPTPQWLRPWHVTHRMSTCFFTKSLLYCYVTDAGHSKRLRSVRTQLSQRFDAQSTAATMYERCAITLRELQDIQVMSTLLNESKSYL